MRAILFLTLLLTTLGAYSQTQPSLPSGTVPYSTNLYRATDGSIWTGKTGSYTNLGNKQYVDSLASIGYTNEMIDSIALYNYDRARNRANHTGTQAQSTVVNLVSDLAGKENISNKVTSLSSPNDTTYPTSKAVSDAIGAIDFPVTSVNTKTGDVVLSKSDVGLDSVDNTSDLNKPISNSTQSALDGKQDSLISGTNIKTINSESLLGSGNISINADTPTLQEVTTEGNETSKPILITSDENVPALYSGVEVSSVGTIKYDEGVRLSAMVLHQDDGTWSVFKDAGGPSLGIFYVNDGTNITETPYDHIMTNVPFKGVPATELDEFVTLGQLNDSLDNHSGGGGSSQNLQQVTTEGNVTDKGLLVTGSAGLTGSNGLSIGRYNNSGYVSMRHNDEKLGALQFYGYSTYLTAGDQTGGTINDKTELELYHSPSGGYATFNSRVKGEDALNDDEFVTKAQLESATNNQIISIRGVTTAWDSVSLDFMSFNIYNLASDTDTVYLKITNRSDRELSYRVVRSTLSGQSTGTISIMDQSTDIPIQDAGTGMTNFSVFILDYLDSYKVVGIYDILVAGAYDDDLHPSFWRINTLYEDNPTSPIE